MASEQNENDDTKSAKAKISTLSIKMKLPKQRGSARNKTKRPVHSFLTYTSTTTLILFSVKLEGYDK